MAKLVPDVERRREIELEQPSVPLVLYETSVQIPRGWRELPSTESRAASSCDLSRGGRLKFPVTPRFGAGGRPCGSRGVWCRELVRRG
jgi:hypothetical protein